LASKAPLFVTACAIWDKLIIRLKKSIVKRVFKFARRKGVTKIPTPFPVPTIFSLTIAFNLLNSTDSVADAYFSARGLMLKCDPKLFCYVDTEELLTLLSCLSFCQERSLITAIAHVCLDKIPYALRIDSALALGASCLAVNEESLAERLLSEVMKKPRSNHAQQSLSGVFPVRTIFPNHLGRTDATGLCHFIRPGIAGIQNGTETVLPIPYDRCAIIEKATVAGAFTIIDGEGRIAVYDLAAHPALPSVAGHRSLLKGSPLAMDRAVMHYPYQAHEQLSEAIHLAGRCASNYFHWVAEYLPRLLNAIEADIDSNVPLIIPGNIPRSMRRALSIANAGRFTIHELHQNTLLSVERLHVPSMQSYIVDGRAIPFDRIGAFSPRHLRFVRERILGFVNQQQSGRRFSPKVYLTRRGRARSTTNEDEIQSALEGMGFSTVDPGELDFIDQIRLFRDAETIVGATGAAMTNLLFCEKDPDVFAFVGRQNVDFAIFANMLQVAGDGRYNQVPGTPAISRAEALSEERFIHSNYTVDVRDLIKALTLGAKAKPAGVTRCLC
jgi:Glycosyltransferase 61